MNIEGVSHTEVIPKWLYRSGISAVGIVTLLLLALAALIKYPDVTSSVGIMTSETPPIEHKTNATGIIDSIYVGHKSHVVAGDKILLIKSACDPEEIEIIDSFIEEFESVKRPTDYPALTFPGDLHLGDLQSDYVAFRVNFFSFLDEIEETYSRQKVEILESEIRNLNQLNAVLEKQQSLYDKEFDLAKKEHARNKTLKSANVISDQDMEKADKDLITLEKQLTSIETSKIENKIRQASLELEIKELLRREAELDNGNLLRLRGSASSLKQSVRNWKEKYVVTAKISGQVLLSPGIARKSKIDENEYVASVVPIDGSSENYIRALAPSHEIGKLKVNSKVIVRVDGYPYKQYGSVIAKIAAVASIPKEDREGKSFYEVRIDLPPEIVTNYDIKIPFRPNTKVIAEIVNDDKTILERIFQDFLGLINQE